MQDAPAELEPASVEDAKLWIHLHQQYATAEQTAAGSLRRLRRFADSEQFHAFVVYTFATRVQSPDVLSESLLDEARRETERFFDKYPDSRYLQRISATDPQAVIAQMDNLVRPTSEQQQWRARLIHGAVSDQLPLSSSARGNARPPVPVRSSSPEHSPPARSPIAATVTRTAHTRRRLPGRSSKP
ncbi:hypothetical protein K1W54_30670 [Micromonospora sp. CPCC 205371]|nr:hypothetical protein [Micromonospora sp. CPCC 205371]